MMRCRVAALALCAVLAACDSDPGSNAGPTDGASDARKLRIDAPEDRSMVCGQAGSSTVTGAGPDGSFAAGHVYAFAVLNGFCPPLLTLVVTNEPSLAWPYLRGSAEIRVEIAAGHPTTVPDWAGTYAATIARPDGTAAATGTVVVEHATPETDPAPRIRATAQFDDRDWHFTAAIDAAFCSVTACLF